MNFLTPTCALRTSNFPVTYTVKGSIRREGFVVSESSKLCREHFKPDDFDGTGQISLQLPMSSPRVGVFLLYMLTEMSMIHM